MSKYSNQLTFMHYIMIIQNVSIIVIHNPKVESKYPKHIMSISWGSKICSCMFHTYNRMLRSCR